MRHTGHGQTHAEAILRVDFTARAQRVLQLEGACALCNEVLTFWTRLKLLKLFTIERTQNFRIGPVDTLAEWPVSILNKTFPHGVPFETRCYRETRTQEGLYESTLNAVFPAT